MRSNVSTKNPEYPAISVLADTIQRCFPEITLFTTNSVSPGTRHTADVAIDIMLDSINAGQRGRAEGMIAVFIKLHQKMLWSDIIFTNYHVPAGRPRRLWRGVGAAQRQLIDGWWEVVQEGTTYHYLLPIADG